MRSAWKQTGPLNIKLVRGSDAKENVRIHLRSCEISDVDPTEVIVLLALYTPGD